MQKPLHCSILTISGTSLSFAYDADGLRTGKTVSGTTYRYYYASGKLMRLTWGSNTVDFFYDANGTPYAMKYNGTLYYYVTNLQGDVMRIVNASGTVVASYDYDPYGKVISATGTLANINPLRYRGYVYDTETGFYYLQSRYYDPTIGRFLNVDSYVSTGQGIIGYNMYSYCGNKPISRIDTSGGSWIAILLIASTMVILSGCSANTSSSNQTTTASTAPTIPPTTAPCTTAPSSNYSDFLDALGMRESSNNYGAKNQYGYLGRYQMGSLALQDAGFMDGSKKWTSTANSYDVYSEDDFLSNHAAQDAAITAYHTRVCGYIRNYGLDQYIGTVYCGVEVTRSGLLAACHLVGVGSMRDALSTGVIKYDGNGVPASEYMDLFGGYNISEVW